MDRDPQQQRYARQTVLPEIGRDGQARLAAAHVLVLGCGALGSVQAELLARAGVGRLRLVDRDLPETGNLQRQFLYDEEDVAQRRPKAEAAARRLRRINSAIAVEAVVADAVPANIERLLDGVTLALDGLDNFETRYLLNDACVQQRIPWVYGGVLGTAGQVMPVVPGRGPCFRCLFPEAPAAGSLPTCDIAGVLNSASATVAALQAAQALRLLTGNPPAADDGVSFLLTADVWNSRFRSTPKRRRPDCPCCGAGRFEYLAARQTAWCTSLCGRNAVQITPAESAVLDPDELAARLAALGRVERNGMLVECEDGAGHRITVFPDGRTIVHGTSDLTAARRIAARFLGI